MNIKIIRGQNQIGGSIIEIFSYTTKIVLDVGSELNKIKPCISDIYGLFSGKAFYMMLYVFLIMVSGANKKLNL